MNEEEVKRIIQEELSGLLGLERYTFQKHIQLFDGRNIQTGRATGTKIGTATDQLLAFYGVTPVNQPATISDPSGGGTQDAEARTAINAIKINTWYHVVATFNGTSKIPSLYIDGIEAIYTAQTAGIGLTNIDANSLVIAGDEDNRRFDGEIDKVMVFDKALTNLEVADLYNKQKGGRR